MKRTINAIVALTVVFLAPHIIQTGSAFASKAPGSKDCIDFWLTNYEVLDPDSNIQAAEAHKIFRRVVNAAGSRPGIIPRLIVIREDPFGVSPAFALPDGGIVLSKRAIDVCYSDPLLGEDRLAFVIAHEVVHQINEDFWHLMFFEALSSYGKSTGANKALIRRVKAIAMRTDDVRAKELHADERGIIYASMAGFNTRAVVSRMGNINFFADWVRALDPAAILGVSDANMEDHLSATERAEAVMAGLNQVIDKVDVFTLGVLFYEAGKYCEAADAFQSFLAYFPSREVYHNLATCYHQLAYQVVGKQEDKRQTAVPFQFQLSLSIDTRTLLQRATRGTDSSFEALIDHAVELYNEAIDLDPGYALAHNNLGCAYLVSEKYAKGIGQLEDALALDSTSAATLNNIGVGYFLFGRRDLAETHLSRANEIDPAYGAPLFNLGRIALADQDTLLAAQYWKSYIRIDSVSPWASTVRQVLGYDVRESLISQRPVTSHEDILGAGLLDSTADLKRKWGEPLLVKRIDLKSFTCPPSVSNGRDYQQSYEMSTFANNVMTVSDDLESVVLVTTLPGFQGHNEDGIRRGSSGGAVLKSYGAPFRTVQTAHGRCWVYDGGGRHITFVMDPENIVDRWLIYQ